MRVLVLSRYGNLGSSSRYRIFQYIPYLKELGWEITIHSLLNDEYINYLYGKGSLPFGDIIKNYIVRMKLLMNRGGYDLIWLQQEAFPWFPPIIESFFLKSKVPIIVDHDDAFFHRYDLNKSVFIRKFLGKKIDRTMDISDLVVAGNDYIADRASKGRCRDIIIIPTVIDINKYSKKENENSGGGEFIIGWIGSPPNFRYVKNIEKQLTKFCSSNRGKLHVVGGGDELKIDIPHENIIWREESEVSEIKKFDVGIMPLADTPWERGKCGFKIIQYMACGIPVIVSPVGVNKDIVIDGVNGFLAYTEDDWSRYLIMLKENPELRRQMGVNGRKLAEEKYTLQVNVKPLINSFNKALGHR